MRENYAEVLALMNKTEDEKPSNIPSLERFIPVSPKKPVEFSEDARKRTAEQLRDKFGFSHGGKKKNSQHKRVIKNHRKG